MMVSLQKPTGILLLSYLMAASLLLTSVQSQGISGMMSLLGRFQGGGGGIGGLGGGGKRHGGGNEGLAALLATGLLAKLFSDRQSNCYHHEGRDNSFALAQQRAAFLQHQNALYQMRYAHFQPRFAHFQPRFAHYQPRSIPLPPRPTAPLQPRATQFHRYANQARLEYLRQKQVPFLPVIPPYQSQASHRIPFIHGLLHGYF